jgi:hypothetical protein
VDTYALFLALRPERPLDDAAVDALGAVLRPEDDDLRIWREDGRGLLRVSTECAAEDLDAALQLGHDLGAEALTAWPGRAAGGVGSGRRGLARVALGALTASLQGSRRERASGGEDGVLLGVPLQSRPRP